MTTLREAAQQVPKEWLEAGAMVPVTVESVGILLNALRAALAQREWAGLTDDKTLWEMWVESPSDVLAFAHAIEAKLKEKNT